MKKVDKIEDDTVKLFKRKIKQFNKNDFKTTEVLFLIILTAFISLIMGYLLNNKKNSQNTSDEALNEIIDNYYYIIDNYYDDIDKDTLISGAIDGMVNSLGDDYSELLEGDSSSTFYKTLEGSYEGIGIEIYNDQNNNIVILDVLDNSPAEVVGIKSGDIVKKIDDKNLENTDISELTKYVKENEKETYNLIIIRDGKEISFNLERKQITIKSVLSKVFEKENRKIGYIYISIFSNTTPEQFKKSLDDLEKQNIDSLIIDVRENSGGRLTTVVSLLSEILDSSHVIYNIEKDGQKTKYYSKGQKTKEYPIVVLQNENSASASELLSAALKEEYGATIVGNTSYGKGTVQEIVYLSNGDTYKFTTKKWLTPKGNWIHKKGVIPDIEVSLDENYRNNPTDDNDKQLQAAISYIIEES